MVMWLAKNIVHVIDWSKWFAISNFPPFIVLVSCLWVLGMKNIKPTTLDMRFIVGGPNIKYG
jgi:hypothetical protein